MAGEFFEDTRGNRWWADIDAICSILITWADAKAQVDAHSVLEENGMQNLDFNARQYRRAYERYYQQEIASVSTNIYTTPEIVSSQLVRRFGEIPNLKQEKSDIGQRMRRHNYEVINRWVETGERNLAVAQATRDLSAAIFMCCLPTVASGLTVAAVGSVIEGISTYQDTGNSVATIATTVLSFKSSLIGITGWSWKSGENSFRYF